MLAFELELQQWRSCRLDEVTLADLNTEKYLK